MYWEVKLSGPVGVIEELARHCNSPKCRVTKNGVLQSSWMDATDHAEKAWVEAHMIVRSLSTTYPVLINSDHPIRVNTLSRVHDDGSRRDFYFTPIT